MNSFYHKLSYSVSISDNDSDPNKNINFVCRPEGLYEWERMVIADALEEVTFSPGQDIVVEGEDGFDFFIIVDG